MAKKLDIFVIIYLDDIFIYTKVPGQAHINAVWWILKKLKKNNLFANLKKCRFHKDKVRFLEYVVSAQGIWIKKERIDVVINWPELKSICDIQVFLGFANFHCCFIQDFSKIAVLLISMLRISPTPISATQKLIDLVDEFGRGDCDKNEEKKTFALIKRPTRADYLSSNHVSYVVRNFVSNSAKNVSNYLIPDTKKTFDQLRQIFTKAPMLQHFDLEQYIQVETDVSGYAIGGLLSQLTNDFGQWHPMSYFLRKIILAEIQYKTHNGKLLTIVEAFKIWQNYLEGCKYNIFVLSNHNNFCRFMDTKSLSSRQVR